MFSLKSLPLVLLVTILGSSRHAHCVSVPGSGSSLNPSQNVDRVKEGTGPTHSISPSFSYQFHTNDYEHLDPIVLSHDNPGLSSATKRVSASEERRDPGSSGKVVENVNDATIAPGPNFRYQPSSNLPTNQQENIPTDAQRTRDLERKQQQFPPQLHQRSSPPAILTEKTYSTLPQAQGRESKSTKDGLTANTRTGRDSWNPVVRNGKGIQTNSTSFVYSRPLVNQAGTSQNVYQRQQSQTYGNGQSSFPNPGYKPSRMVPSGLKPSSYNMANGKVGGKRQILQARADESYDKLEDVHDDIHEDDPYNEEEHEHHDMEDTEHKDQEQMFTNTNTASVNDVSGNPPEVRDFGFPGDHVPLDQGPFADPFAPMPPPPPPLKGSVDYILIPLILIGLAGPIFVVLYVILGSFEARLSPISRSLNDYSWSDYKPYVDTVTSSVGRALEKYECLDYAMCRFSGYCNRMGLSRSMGNTIESSLSSVTPKEYLPALKTVFTSLKNSDEDCARFRCSRMVESLPSIF